MYVFITTAHLLLHQLHVILKDGYMYVLLSAMDLSILDLGLLPNRLPEVEKYRVRLPDV